MSPWSHLVATTVGTFALAVAGAASAAGQVEINHARALAGGVSPGDGPGYPVTISQSGSYVLTSNLTPTGTAGGISIELGVRNVALDLAGFAIVGPVVCTRGASDTTCVGAAGTGVLSQGNNVDIAVHDGSVRGMGVGVSLFATNTRVERVQATSNASVGISAAGVAMVESSIADLNGGFGIGTANDSTVRNSVAKHNGDDGIVVGSGCTLIGNTTNGNGVGIRSFGGSTLIGNTAMDNVSFGFVLGAGAPTGYSKNVLISNNGNALGAQTNPELSPGTQLEIGINVCGTDTVCP